LPNVEKIILLTLIILVIWANNFGGPSLRSEQRCHGLQGAACGSIENICHGFAGAACGGLRINLPQITQMNTDIFQLKSSKRIEVVHLWLVV
jgi:hypothetical protein